MVLKWFFVVGLPGVEILCLIFAVKIFGFFIVLLSLACKICSGAYMLNRLGMESIQRMANAIKMGYQLGYDMQIAAVRLFGAILLLFPGFLTLIPALALFLRPVQKSLIQWRSKQGGIFSESLAKPIVHEKNRRSAND